MTTITMNTQVELEKEMSALGFIRFGRNQQKLEAAGMGSICRPQSTLVSLGIESMSKAIDDWLNEALTGVGKRHSASGPLAILDPDVVAFITLRFLFDSVKAGLTIQAMAVKLADRIVDEIKIAAVAKQSAKYFFSVKESLRSSSAFMVRSKIIGAAKKKGYVLPEWNKTVRLNIGMVLIDLAIRSTGFFEQYYDSSEYGSDTPIRVILSKKTEEWIGKRAEQCAMFAPMYMPTVIPPKEWDGPFGGGYHSEFMPTLKLVKTTAKAYLEELETFEMPEVYEAVNAIQNTPWQINTQVLDVMQALWETGGGVADLPSQHDREIPPLPVNLDMDNRENWNEEEKKIFREWKFAAKNAHSFNDTLRGKRLSLLKALWVAEKYKQFETIYFPHQCDFRGRVYAVPSYLQPQGPDTSRGLLRFTEGKPIENAEQMKWFAVHGANCWGEDKCTLDQRVHWVRDNTDNILAVAADPLNNLWWSDADKPFQFLAWALEWAEFTKVGYGFVSHIPVAMDGSCNGLQIFSLILRDEIGGKATNLLPSDKPQDIYGIVADKVLAKLNRIVQTGQGEPEDLVLAEQWLAWGLNRKATKRQVMVIPYGGTFSSCQEYTLQYIESRVNDGETPPWGNFPIKPGKFLAKLIWESIHETVIAARGCMTWLQDVAKVATKAGLPVTWIAPSGFPVYQAYPETKSKRVKTTLGDTCLKLTIREETGKLDSRRQTMAVSPNFIHSLDAAALVRSVNKAVAEGVNAFAMIHDSYGTHTADAPTLARTLREAFVEMFLGYQVLEDFCEDIKPLLGKKSQAKLPALPPQGNLEVAKVLESEYFFA